MTMTTMHLLTERATKYSSIRQANPPTYVESTTSNTSYVKDPSYDQGHPLAPSYSPSVVVQDHKEQRQKQEQFTGGSEKRISGRFNQRFHSVTFKVGWSLNKAANVIGAEGWWPTGMEKECSKAARILHSFTRTYSPAVLTLPRQSQF